MLWNLCHVCTGNIVGMKIWAAGIEIRFIGNTEWLTENRSYSLFDLTLVVMSLYISMDALSSCPMLFIMQSFYTSVQKRCYDIYAHLLQAFMWELSLEAFYKVLLELSRRVIWDLHEQTCVIALTRLKNKGLHTMGSHRHQDPGSRPTWNCTECRGAWIYVLYTGRVKYIQQTSCGSPWLTLALNSVATRGLGNCAVNVVGILHWTVARMEVMIILLCIIYKANMFKEERYPKPKFSKGLCAFSKISTQEMLEHQYTSSYAKGHGYRKMSDSSEQLSCCASLTSNIVSMGLMTTVVYPGP